MAIKITVATNIENIIPVKIKRSLFATKFLLYILDKHTGIRGTKNIRVIINKIIEIDNNTFSP